MPNRLKLIRDWVERGGGLMMIGGYFSFQGIDGKARWRKTAGRGGAAGHLPARGTTGSRCPKARWPRCCSPTIRSWRGWTGPGPSLLGVNEVEVRAGRRRFSRGIPDDQGGHPLLVLGGYGKGRTAAWTSDIGPHWLSPAFCAWEGYGRLWKNLLGWLAHDRG